MILKLTREGAERCAQITELGERCKKTATHTGGGQPMCVAHHSKWVKMKLLRKSDASKKVER